MILPTEEFGFINQDKRERMQIETILNHVQKPQSFVYKPVRWVENASDPTIEVDIQPRSNSHPLCSICGYQRPGSLSDLGNRSEGKSFWVKFFDRMRRIVVLFNELDREIWPKWLFCSRFILSSTGSWVWSITWTSLGIHSDVGHQSIFRLYTQVRELFTLRHSGGTDVVGERQT